LLKCLPRRNGLSEDVQTDSGICNSVFNPNVAKIGGLQSQGAKAEAVVNLLRTLGNSGSGVLRLSRRVNNMASNRPHPLNSSGVENQKGKHFYDFCLKLAWLIPFLPCCLCNVRVNLTEL